MRFHILFITTVVGVTSTPIASGQTAPARTVQAKLICGPHTSNPDKRPEFQASLTFRYDGRTLTAKRHLKSNGGGEENFTGQVSEGGSILLSGRGSFKQGGAWVYEFMGSSKDSGDTVLSGNLINTEGSIGKRECTMTFYKPRAL